MCKIKKVKSASFFPLVSELLDQGRCTIVTVTGMSMYPFLREGKDSVEFVKADFDNIKRGHIVLIKRISGMYIMHRVLKKSKNSFTMIGDAQQWIEGPLVESQVVAVVKSIYRKKRKIDCSNKLWIYSSLIWLNLIPLRRVILKFFRIFGKIKNLLFK